MRPIEYSMPDEIGIYDEVVLTRNTETRARLQELRSAIQTHYNNYLTRVTQIDSPLAVWSESDKKKLQSNYERLREKETLFYVRRLIFTRSRYLCAYCNNGKPSHIDHYLPRDSFPEYSIYTHNLVPACPWCNPKKGAEYVDDSGNAIYLHAYLDDLSSEPLLHVHIEVIDAAVFAYFSPARPYDMTSATYQSWCSQFRKLALGEMFADEATLEMQSLRDVYDDSFRGDGVDGLRATLRSIRKGAITTYGKNHWRPALYSALIESDEFCKGGYRSIPTVPL